MGKGGIFKTVEWVEMYFIARLRWLADADESACKFKAFFRCFGSSVYLVASCSLALLYTHSHAHAKPATVVIATAIDFSTFLHSLLRARTGNRLVQLFNKRTQHYHLHVELFSPDSFACTRDEKRPAPFKLFTNLFPPPHGPPVHMRTVADILNS